MPIPAPVLSRFFAWIEARPISRLATVFAPILLLAYAGMRAEQLTFDNTFIIGDDIRLRSFTWESWLLIFHYDYWWPTQVSNLYRPLSTLSFWFEYCFLGYGQ